MTADVEFLEEDGDRKSPSLMAGVAALKGDKEQMLALLNESLHKTISPRQLREFPVFEDYRADPDFVKLYEVEPTSSPSAPKLVAEVDASQPPETIDTDSEGKKETPPVRRIPPLPPA